MTDGQFKLDRLSCDDIYPCVMPFKNPCKVTVFFLSGPTVLSSIVSIFSE